MWKSFDPSTAEEDEEEETRVADPQIGQCWLVALEWGGEA